MARFDEQRICAIARRILDEALRAGMENAVSRTLGIGLALACLHTVTGGDRKPFDEFWSGLAMRDALSRQVTLQRAMLDIRLRLGEIDERAYLAGRLALPIPTKKGWR